MFFYCVGIHARTHPLEKREKYVLSKEEFLLKNQKLVQSKIIQEIVTLSTCNRIEHYLITEEALSSIVGLFFDPIQKDLSIFQGSGASYHLFSVSAGLDSQVLGENEILAQIKKAYESSKNKGLTSRYLNTLFQKAIYVGKKVRTLTDISKYSLATSGIVLEKIKIYFKNLLQIKVLIIGIGNISQSIAISLYKKGINNVSICNKNPLKGKLFAKKMNFNYIHANNIHHHLSDMEVIISSTSAPDYIIRKEDQKYLSQNFKLLIDLAVPRDIDPEIADYDQNTQLINVDDISTLSQLHLKKRKKAIAEVKKIIAFENCHYCYNRLMRMNDFYILGFTNVNQIYKKFKTNYEVKRNSL